MWLSRLLRRPRQDWLLIITIVGLAVAAWSAFLTYRSLPPDPPYLLARVVGAQLPILITGKHLPIKAYWEERFGLEPSPRQIPLDQLTFESIVFSNTGERAFVWDEMVLTPIRVKLTSDEGTILSAAVRQGDDPASLPPYHLEVESKAFVLSVPVLNPGEQIIVDLLHSGEENVLAIEGRIKEQGQLTLNRVRPNRSFWRQPEVTGVAGQQNILMVVFLVLMMVWIHRTTARSWRSSFFGALTTAVTGPWIASVLADLCLATFLDPSKHSATLHWTHGLVSLALSGLYLRFVDSRFSVLFRFPIRLTEKSDDQPP